MYDEKKNRNLKAIFLHGDKTFDLINITFTLFVHELNIETSATNWADRK